MGDIFNPDPSKFSTRFVGPRGSNHPHLYICGEAPGREEDAQLEPFVGPAGGILDEAIVVSGVDKTLIRYWNCIPYRPISGWSNRTPLYDEIKLYGAFVLKDIRKTKPKIIMAVGRSAMTLFGITNTAVGASRAYKYEFEGIPLFTSWHPSFALRQGGIHTPSFKDLVNDIQKAWKGNVQTIIPETKFEVIDVLEDPSKVLEKIDYIKRTFQSRYIALDTETNSLNQYHHNFFIGQIALRDVETKHTAIVKLFDFWRTPEEADQESLKLFKKHFSEWILTKHLIVFNAQFDLGAILTYFGVYVRNVTDVLMWNRMLGHRGSLKEVAQRYLGVARWSTEVDDFNAHMEKLLRYCKATRKGNPRREILFIKENKPNTFEELITNLPTFALKEEKQEDQEENQEEKHPKKGREKNREIEVLHAFRQINELISVFFSGSRKEEFTKRFFDLLVRRTMNAETEVQFTDIPIEIIGPYAADDVGYTCELYFLMKKEIEEKNLVRAAEIYNSHGKLGFEIESSGIAWDNVKAEELSQIYHSAAVDRLRMLLLHEKFKDILELSPQDILKIQTTTKLQDLTGFFNPRSTHKSTREKFTQLVVTGRVRCMLMLYELYEEYQNILSGYITQLSAEESRERTREKLIRTYPVMTDLLLQIITESDSKLKWRFLDDIVEMSEKLFSKVLTHPTNDKNLWKDKKGQRITPPEAELFVRYCKWDFENLNSGTIEWVSKAFRDITGMDIDKEETFLPEFEVIFNFRLYKKVMKSYSSYIWGKMGRLNICLIDKGNTVKLNQERIIGHLDVLPDDKVWVSETEFAVCTATTKRWQSGTHTVPWGSELIDLRISRFPDGCRIHFDYSQNEVRVLARVANDQKMLQAFREGHDIHAFVASQVFDKSQEAVSEAERRFSKTTTFAILYGDTAEGVATKFFSGDLQRAVRLFNDFYSKFPDIFNWISKQHREAIYTGYITTMFGDPINVFMPVVALNLKDSDKNLLLKDLWTKDIKFDDDWKVDKTIRFQIAKAFRNAQNYGIQNASSMLTGLSLSYIAEYLRDNNFQGRIDCFTHDAGDIDTPIADLPQILSVLPKYSIQDLQDEFQIPVRTDHEIAISGDHSIELGKLKVDGPYIEAHIEGKLKGLEMLTDRFDKYGVKSEITIDKEFEKYRSLSEIFVVRRAFAVDMGHSIKNIKGHLKLDFTNVKRAE